MPTETTSMPRKSWREQLEDSGYAAGLAAFDLEKSSLWGDAWTPGSNDVAWVIAGWVAGRAMRRIRQETGVQNVAA